jgi:transposase
VREGNEVRKEILFPLGALTEQQATQIKLILHTLKKPDDVLVALNDVIPTRSVSYLDVAVANHLWDYWNLDLAFAKGTESELPTRTVARVLTVNRCVCPCSNYAVPRWAERTALPKILGQSIEKLNDDKIYYELDEIEENKEQLERHLFEMTKKRNPQSCDFVNYDLSSSYFVGIRCDLSRFGKSKDNQHYQRQVVLGLLVNRQGYPFKWDVFPGNQAEVHTLADNIAACRKLGLQSVTMVFDRGLVSQKNLKLLSTDQALKFISALDKPQIPKVDGIDLRPFARLPEKAVEEWLKSSPDFKTFDTKVFYKDLGVINEMRHVLSINTKLLREERKLRRQKLRQFSRFLKKLNDELKQAQRDRDFEATRNKVQAELKKLKLKRFFVDPLLKPITVEHRIAKGDLKTVSSFQVEIKRDEAALAAAKLLDGLCVFITNHTQKRGRGYAMNARNILQAYRDKTEIEDAFKNMKSFVKLRPFFVNTDQHVRAVFTICVLAYHLNKTLARMRKEIEGYDFLNSDELYDPFRDSRLVTMTDPTTKSRSEKVIPPSNDTKALLKKLNLSGLLQAPALTM